MTKLSHLSNLYSIHIVLQFCAVLAMTFNSSQAMSLFTHGVPWSVTHALFLEYDIDQHVRRVNNDSINRSIDWEQSRYLYSLTPTFPSCLLAAIFEKKPKDTYNNLQLVCNFCFAALTWMNDTKICSRLVLLADDEAIVLYKN